MSTVVLVCVALGVCFGSGRGVNADANKQFLVVFGPSGFRNSIPREIHVINHDNVAGTVNVSEFQNDGPLGDTKQLINTVHLNLSESRRIPIINTNNFDMNTMYLREFVLKNLDKRTFLIESDIKLSVFAVNKGNASTDSFLVLPVAGLGKNYVVPSWKRKYFGSGFGSSFITLAAASPDPVAINLTFPWRMEEPAKSLFAMKNKYKNPYPIRLNGIDLITYRGRSVQIMADLDLTGTVITSDKPIAVVAGNERTSIFGNEAIVVNGTIWDKDGSEEVTINGTNWKNSYDHIEEMIPPVSTWGKHFITVPLAERKSGDVFKVLASKDNTEVRTQRYHRSRFRRDTSIQNVPMTSSQTHTIARAGDWMLEYASSDEFLVLEASEQILLVQYSKSSTSDFTEGDPFMMIVPPVEQYVNKYVFETFSGVIRDEYSNFIALVIKSNLTNGLTFDGGSFIPNNVAPWIELGDSGFSAATLLINPGSHSLRHSDPTATFMVLSYGFVKYEAYGHPAGMRHSPLYSYCQPTTSVAGDGIDNDCDGRIDEEHDNGIDDDGDGRVDEDLAELLPLATTASAPDQTTLALKSGPQFFTSPSDGNVISTAQPTVTTDEQVTTTVTAIKTTSVTSTFESTVSSASVDSTTLGKTGGSRQSSDGLNPVIGITTGVALLVALGCSIGLFAFYRKCKRKKKNEEAEDISSFSRRSSAATLLNAKNGAPRTASAIHLSVNETGSQILDTDEGIGSLHEADEVFALPEEQPTAEPSAGAKPREAWSRTSTPSELAEGGEGYRGRRGKRNSVIPLTSMDF